MTDNSKISVDNDIDNDESYANSNQKTVGAGDGNAPFIESLYESFIKDPNLFQKTGKFILKPFQFNQRVKLKSLIKILSRNLKIKEGKDPILINWLIINLLMRSKLELSN